MTKFNLGDTVRCINNTGYSNHIKIGQEYVVQKPTSWRGDTEKYCYVVRSDGYGIGGYNNEFFELVKPAVTLVGEVGKTYIQTNKFNTTGPCLCIGHSPSGKPIFERHGIEWIFNSPYRFEETYKEVIKPIIEESSVWCKELYKHFRVEFEVKDKKIINLKLKD